MQSVVLLLPLTASRCRKGEQNWDLRDYHFGTFLPGEFLMNSVGCEQCDCVFHIWSQSCTHLTLAANSSSSSAARPGGESCQRARQTMGVRLNKRRAAGLICVVLTVWLQRPHHHHHHHHTPPEPFLSDEPEPGPTNWRIYRWNIHCAVCVWCGHIQADSQWEKLTWVPACIDLWT